MSFNDKLRLAEERLPRAVMVWFWHFYEEETTRLRYPQGSRRVLDFLAYQNRRGLAVGDVSYQLLVDYLLAHDADWTNRAGRLHYRSVLRRWLRFLYRQHVLLYPWHEEIDYRCQGDHQKRKPLTYPQVKKLLRAPDLKTPWGLLFRAVLELLYGCALRRSELTELNLADVDLQERAVYIRCSKNGAGRALPIPGPVHHFLVRYLLEVRASWCKEDSDDAFFLEMDGQRLDPKQLLKQLRGCCQYELGFPFQLHQLRHSCATHLLTAGLDVAHVKVFLGHRQLSSTQVYTHLTPVELQRIHARCHPANRL